MLAQTQCAQFLDLLFEDLELPNLVKTKLKTSEATQLTRAGYSMDGTPANFSIRRTMRNSLARRISLNRPSPSDIEAMERQLKAAEGIAAPEQGIEDVLDAPEASARREPAGAKTVLTEAVIRLAALLIREHLVGLRRLLELLLGLRIVGVDVRMQLASQLPEGLLDLAVRGAPIEAQHLVIVALRHRSAAYSS